MKLKLIIFAFVFAFAPLALASLMPEDGFNSPIYQTDSSIHRSWLRLMEM
jgi:hypothetical protein